MHEAFAIQILMYAHLTSLALWLGGLFGYVVIVWPAIMSDATGRFPRSLLAGIAMRTAPWIYSAMGLALLTFVVIGVTGSIGIHRAWIVAYGLLLSALVGNNVYGSMVAWPRMMLLPMKSAGQVWFWFRVRMTVALVVGLALYCVMVYCDLIRR
jgi:hypothetical protein